MSRRSREGQSHACDPGHSLGAQDRARILWKRAQSRYVTRILHSYPSTKTGWLRVGEKRTEACLAQDCRCCSPALLCLQDSAGIATAAFMCYYGGMVEIDLPTFVAVLAGALTAITGIVGSAFVFVWRQARPYIDRAFAVLDRVADNLQHLNETTERRQNNEEARQARIEQQITAIHDKSTRILSALRVAIEAHRLEATSAGLVVAHSLLAEEEEPAA